MATPLVLTFNLRRSVFEHLGLSLFRAAAEVQLCNRQRLILLPVVNSLEDCIEQRAQTIARLLPGLLKAQNVEHCHLVSYSLSGLDARFAVTNLGMSKHVQSVTTLATPHLGCRLAWIAERKVFSDKLMEPIARLVGVGLRPFYEVNAENLKHFNRRVTNVDSVKYYSIGAERLPNNMTLQLRETGNHMRLRTQPNFVYQNDGVVGHDECQWGEHLVNFQADHTELVGINPYDQLQNVFNLVQDNARQHEVEAQQ